LKILVLSNLYPPDVIGGYEQGCKQAVDALRARGHEVRVVTTSPRKPVPVEGHVTRTLQLSEIWNDYMFHHSRPVISHLVESESNLVNAFNVHALTRVIDEFQPDVAYVWMIVGIGGLGLMATLQHLRVPWLWHLMDDVPIELCKLSGQPVSTLLKEVDRQLVGKYLACSRQLVEEIEAGGVRLRPDVEVVPNWVVGEEPAPRTRFYQPGTGEPLRIVAAGQINRNKGADLIIETASLLRQRGHDGFTIEFFGNVNDAYFPTLVKTREVQEHVIFRGFRPQAELVQLYLERDVFAFPTWPREPFGFAPLEAAWRGCVPLISQFCGYAEWFVSGVHCLKAERHQEAFADSIAAILDGTTRLEPIARRAATVIGRDFHLDTQIQKIEQALDRAARRVKASVAGSSSEAYRMALLAEKLTRVLVQESVPVG
jgi:glycosyltransferase involved in cell wall biosynthesis